MTTANQNAVARYKNSFLKEVEANVEDGHMVKMCMQCGVCAGSCPLGNAWEHSPQKLFMMIRAGKRDEVLKSDSMWMCTSCYNCISRCPRKLPITHIMHGLANYAYRLGIAPQGQPTQGVARMFWDNLAKTGRINELKFAIDLYFKDGLASGMQVVWNMKEDVLGLVKANRLNLLELFSAHECQDKIGIQKMLAKAREIEDRRKGFTQ